MTTWIIHAPTLPRLCVMEARERSRTTQTIQGRAWRSQYGTIENNWSNYTPLAENCIDVVGNPRGDNYFLVEAIRRSPVILNGRSTGGTQFTRPSFHTAEDYAVDILNLPAIPPSLADNRSNQVLANRGVALANPSRPTLDLPVFSFELRDLPKMIRSIGLLLLSGRRIAKVFIKNHRDIGNRFLEWTFGWQPLISDLRKTLSLVDATEKRFRELKKLQQSGLHRKITLYEDTAQTIQLNRLLTNVAGLTSYGTLTIVSDRKTWVSSRWRARPQTFPTRNAEIMALAHRLTTGENISYSQVWQAMPWSWLFDYFNSFGDLLEANAGSYTIYCESQCVMKSVRTTGTVTVTSRQPSVSYSGGNYMRTRKERFPISTLAAEAYLPFLSGGQTSILSALALSRMK